MFTLGWMCPLKREQARRERESELRLVNLLWTVDSNVEIGRKIGHELRNDDHETNVVSTLLTGTKSTGTNERRFFSDCRDSRRKPEKELDAVEAE